MRAARQPHLDFEPQVIRAGVDGEQLRARAFADGQADAVQLGPGSAEDEALAAGLAGRELDGLPLAELLGRERLQRRKIGVAPFLVPGGGKGDKHAHAATAS